MDARTIVKIKKVGEAFTVEELGWTMPVLDALGSLVGEIAGETVEEKAPGSDAVVFTVDLWGRESEQTGLGALNPDHSRDSDGHKVHVEPEVFLISEDDAVRSRGECSGKEQRLILDVV